MFERSYKIFAIRCNSNKKIYIGATLESVETRIRNILCCLRRNSININRALLDDYNKYGEKDFEFYTLEEGKDLCKQRGRLEHFIDQYKTYDEQYGYNTQKRRKEDLVIKQEMPEIPN